MHNRTDFQKQTLSATTFVSGCLSDVPDMDLEAQDSQTCVSLEERSYSASPCLMDTAGRAPSRVDSCPDMDTRPPLTLDLMGMDTDAQLSRVNREDAFHMHELLSELPSYNCQPSDMDPRSSHCSRCDADSCSDGNHQAEQPCLLHIAMGKGLAHELTTESSRSRGLLMTDSDTDVTINLFHCDEGTLTTENSSIPLARLETLPTSKEHREQGESLSSSPELSKEDFVFSVAQSNTPQQLLQESDPQVFELSQKRYSALEKVPGPCEPEDLMDGVVFGAKYLGSTQLKCETPQQPSSRMQQAQEAVNRVKAPDGESQPMTEVDVLVSTRCVKVLNADTQEALMDHPLQTISYTADIGSIVVIMAKRKSSRRLEQHKMLCHVFQSADAQLIAQAIGQAFGMAYKRFLLSEGVESEQLERTRVMEQLYNADLDHFSKKDNCREVYIQKQKGEALGVAFVESGWGSLLPTVVIANLMHGGPAERSGELSIGDHVTSVNGTSLVGLPFSTCQGLIRELKSQSRVILSIVHCPPVMTAIIQRPDTSYQLGFCVEDGVISSLVRGGIAERGGIRVGHRIIEINGQSVVATAHDKIIQTLLDATGEVHIKTMPASTYRLLTGQETPVYL